MNKIKRLSETWCPVCGTEGVWQYTDFETIPDPDRETGEAPFTRWEVYWCDQCQESFNGTKRGCYGKPWNGKEYRVNK